MCRLPRTLKLASWRATRGSVMALALTIGAVGGTPRCVSIVLSNFSLGIRFTWRVIGSLWTRVITNGPLVNKYVNDRDFRRFIIIISQTYMFMQDILVGGVSDMKYAYGTLREGGKRILICYIFLLQFRHLFGISE